MTDPERIEETADAVGRWLGSTNAPIEVIEAQERVAAALREARERLEAYAAFDDVIAALSDARREDYQRLSALAPADEAKNEGGVEPPDKDTPTCKAPPSEARLAPADEARPSTS